MTRAQRRSAQVVGQAEARARDTYQEVTDAIVAALEHSGIETWLTPAEQADDEQTDEADVALAAK